MKRQRQDCPRCHGLIVETYSDVASPDNAGQDVIGWRCVNCGEYMDRLVLLNR
jgi:RNase P subunit RPR2